MTGAVALDGKTLDESGRVLLIHVSDVAQGGVKYQTSARDVILDFAGGKGPILARRAVSRITLQTKGNRKLYALDIVGRRICEVPFSLKDGSLTFTADTFGDAGIVFAYELVR